MKPLCVIALLYCFALLLCFIALLYCFASFLIILMMGGIIKPQTDVIALLHFLDIQTALL
jgi:hypothetical protein